MKEADINKSSDDAEERLIKDYEEKFAILSDNIETEAEEADDAMWIAMDDEEAREKAETQEG